MSTTQGAAPNLIAAVDEAAHWDRLMRMARLGAIADGEGVNRACLTPLDREARRALIAWGAEIGLTASVDPIGNLFLRAEATAADAEPGAAPVLVGSHMDTQPQGGRFDGMWGVLAALDAVRAIREAGVALRRPVEVVAWTNEEGGRFAPGCMGSMAYAGAWTGAHDPAAWDASTDLAGVSFRDALAEHRAAEADLPQRGFGGPKPHAYLEAHIEQGPRLEAEGFDVGIVSGIQGARWFNVELRGEGAHAGTAPLAGRRDAVQDMVRAINALNALTTDPEDVLRFTVGRIEVSPNSSNTVADLARFTVDLRHPDRDVLLLTGDAVENTVRTTAKRCEASVTETFHAVPVEFDLAIREALEDAAAAQGLKALHLPSGAFHDARFLETVCPSGMLFVPSRGGISHNPAEYTAPPQLAAGIRVLAATLARLANG